MFQMYVYKSQYIMIDESKNKVTYSLVFYYVTNYLHNSYNSSDEAEAMTSFSSSVSLLSPISFSAS